MTGDGAGARRTAGRARGAVGRGPFPPLVAALVLTIAVAGCGGSDDRTTDDGGPAGAAAPDRSVEADASDPEAVRPYVDALLARHDDIVNALAADPTAVSGPDAPLADDYLALFEPGNEAAAATVDVWVESADDGVVMQPYSDADPIFTLRVDGAIERVADDEVRFPVCGEERSIVVRDGQPVQHTPYLPQPGEGTAVMVDGSWRLRSVDLFPNTAGCTTEEPT